MHEITLRDAIILSTSHTMLYVGVLYVREASRPSPTKSKEFPSVIKARFAAVSVAVLLSVLANRYIIKNARQSGQRTGIPAWDDILGGWGEWKLDLWKTWRALILTAILFFGPLVDKFWVMGEWRGIYSGINNAATSLSGWRNYVIVNLPTSELTTGSCIWRDCVSRMYDPTVPYGACPSTDDHLRDTSFFWSRYKTLILTVNVSSRSSCLRK